MSEQAKHTLGPWEAEVSHTGAFEIRSQTGNRYGGLLVICSRSQHDDVATMQANARRIVHCVNTHDELVNAAQLALAFALLKWGNLDADANAAFDIVRAALSKATGLPQP